MPALAFEASAEGIGFRDTRYATEPVISTFGPDHAAVHAALLREIVLEERLSERTGLDPGRVAAALADLEAARVIYREGTKLTALALPMPCYARWLKKAAARAENLARRDTVLASV